MQKINSSNHKIVPSLPLFLVLVSKQGGGGRDMRHGTICKVSKTIFDSLKDNYC